MWRDLKFALRMVGRERLLSAVVVVTAALGIGGSTAVFSVVSAVLIRDLPYSNAGQLYVMRALAPDGLPGNVTRREFAPIYERENHPTVETASIAWNQPTSSSRRIPASGTSCASGPVSTSARPVCVPSRHNGSVWGRRGRLFPPGAASHEDRSRELVEKRVSGDDAFAIEREACVRCHRRRDQACHRAASIFDVA